MTTSPSRRFTPQLGQEQISRNQFKVRMATFGWVVGTPEVDLGEDLIVHIYFDGRASGVDFFVQLKSITRLDSEKDKPDLTYRFDVHDLEHWASFALPVVLVVWDVKLEEGRWILVSDAIAQLDQKKPTWRSNKSSATVHIPHENDTSDAGLDRLRLAIARHIMPLLTSGGGLEVNMQFSFPDTEEGRAESEKVRKAFEEGEPLDLDGQFIHAFEASNPVARWLMFGANKPSRLELRSAVDDNPRPFTIQLRGRNGQSVEFENVLFRTTSSGTKRDILENDPQTSPVSWKITIWKDEPKPRLSMWWKIRPGTHNVATTHKLLRMMDVTAAGGQFVLSFPTFDEAPVVHEFEPYTLPGPDTLFVEFVDNLYYAQNVTGVSISIPETIPASDIDAARSLHRIFTTGYAELLTYAEYTLPALYKASLALVYAGFDGSIEHECSLEWEGSELEVCGATVPLGPCQTTLRGRFKETRDELKRLIDSMSDEETAKLTLVDVTVTRAYPRWLPPAPPA